MYLIANWKQNKKIVDIDSWVLGLENFLIEYRDSIGFKNINIIICPQLVHLCYLSQKIDLLSKSLNLNNIKISLGSQNLSKFSQGAYTGEVDANSLREFASTSIIGHSERRIFLGETNQDIVEKTKRALDAGLVPIICFSTSEEYNFIANSDLDLHGKELLFAYEPIDAISTAAGSTGALSKEKISETASSLGIKDIIYGGSIDEKNIFEYSTESRISGLLVGSASLDIDRFVTITKALLNL